MGTFTKFHLDVSLDQSKLTTEFIETLVEDLKWFNDRRSCYFSMVKSYAIFKSEKGMYENPNTISINCSCKNYNSEIENFIKLIEPFIEYNSEKWEDDKMFIGYFQKYGNKPNLIYYNNLIGKIVIEKF